LFRVRIFCSRGSLTPVAAPNVFLARGPAAEKRFRNRCLRDVASRPSVETGTNVPGYSGGLAACVVVSDPRLDGCGPQAKCGNRGRRTQLQWRLGRRVVVSDPRSEGSGARANVSSSSAFISGFFFYFLLSSPTPSFPPSLCGVLKKHTSSLGCGSQGWHPGLVCVTPTRANGTTAFRSRIHALP
jgi:hypothetical protein